LHRFALHRFTLNGIKTTVFGYLRYFSMISFVVVTMAAIGLGYYFRESATEDFSNLVMKNNRVLVQGFINNLWRNHPMVSMYGQFRTHSIAPDQWARYKGYKENYAKFSRDVFHYFEGMPVVKVNVYTPTGDKILSLNQEKILDTDMDDTVRLPDNGIVRDVIEQGILGNHGAQVLEDADFSLAGMERQHGTLVQTVVPIMSNNYVPSVMGTGQGKSENVQGVVEIYYDISQQWSRLFWFQYLSSGSIILIFILLIATLIRVAKRAETIISRQHEANLELAAAAATAETENQNKTQFLANISHELRTPLNAIIGFSEIIKNEVMGAIGNPQYKDYIRDIHQSGVHLLSLINDILDYSKAEAGKLDVTLEEVDITKQVLSSMRLVTPRAEQAQVVLEENIPKEHLILLTDAKKFKQIMLNLLSNAVKFTPAGGTVKVSLAHNTLENTVSIEVRDSGIGIAAKDIARALAPFGQVDSALSRKYEGTGLGLPLTKKFVEILGGTFTLTSEENVGTAVTFYLPFKQAA
jgi:two-component system cell cycle sensor histidine kinase PleC